jgi:hypothetical protein
MTLQEVNKSEVDKVSSIEKVLLATHTIAWMSTRLTRLLLQFKQIQATSPNETIAGIIERHESTLNMVVIKLTSIAENLGNFVDGEDAIDAIDTIVTQPAFDILYDRFNNEQNVQGSDTTTDAHSGVADNPIK